ncbi:hypothetical protein [Mesorhizobium australicum]|uniref:hypothetical protein n=1 Tax=Mesorhizobium australicum TaxID=536018 RepID=UPI00059B3C04
MTDIGHADKTKHAAQAGDGVPYRGEIQQLDLIHTVTEFWQVVAARRKVGETPCRLRCSIPSEVAIEVSRRCDMFATNCRRPASTTSSIC